MIHILLKTNSTISIFLLFIFILPSKTIAQKTKTVSTNSIKNFKAIDISDTELQISVDYSYTGEHGEKGVFIQALPRDKNGVFDRKTVDTPRIPVQSGTHHISFNITKTPQSRDFTTESIRICMSAQRSSIICEDFSFTKSWKETSILPKIISFTVNKSKVKKGESVTLSWRTSDANNVKLGQVGSTDFKSVSPAGSQTISPEKNDHLFAYGWPNYKRAIKDGVQKIQVTVGYDPVIGRFSAYPSTIRRGLQSKLTWEAYAAEEVTLNGKTVEPNGQRIIAPTRTQAYTLVARTGETVVKENFTLHVSPFPPPKLAAPFSNIELCKNINKSGDSYQCISPDGPFWMGDNIHAIVRFKNLSAGSHKVKRVIYNSGVLGTGFVEKNSPRRE